MESRIFDNLIRIAGKEGVLCTPEDLAVYSYDGTFAEGVPEVVVLPLTTEQTAEIVKMAAETGIPLVARGMGSGLAAGSIPIRAGGFWRSIRETRPSGRKPESSLPICRQRLKRSGFFIRPILRASGIRLSGEISRAMQVARAA